MILGVTFTLASMSVHPQDVPATKTIITVGDTPLILRSALFGNPVKFGALLSPDGKWVSWIAPVNGLLNVWVAPSDKPEVGKAITASTDHPISTHFWSSDSNQILFIKDNGGDENFHLYGVDIITGKQQDYTPFANVSIKVIGVSSKRQNELLVGINDRDPRWHDVYLLNIKTGKRKLLLKGDGFINFQSDDDLQLRLVGRPNVVGGIDYFHIKGGVVADKSFLSTSLEDSGTSPLGFTSDGRTLYWIDSRDRDTAEKHLDKDFFVVSRTRADDKWIVGVDLLSKVSGTYLYNRQTKHLRTLYVARPELLGAPLMPMLTAEIKARDGLTLPSYLTLPKGSDINGDGKADKRVPMVLLVHGGPWLRDVYGYDAHHQWLANRGYAVLSVNFRASSGFGKKFLTAGNKQWGLAMHTDLLDAVEWAVKQGITSADKVAIMGGSYGGYATLAALAFTPTAFSCGVAIVGPSNLETLLATIPPYWEAEKKQMYSRMGDPTTIEGREILRAASPLYKANQIIRPLLIGQGANDPRVKQAESDQIVAAMQTKNIPVRFWATA